MKKSSRTTFVYPSVIALALFYAILGYIVPEIRTHFSLSLAGAGLFSTLLSAGTVVTVILSICIYAGLNKSLVMTVGLAGLALCLFGLAAAPSVWILCVLFFVIGIFSNTIDTLSCAIMADLAGDSKSRHIGLLQALFSAAGIAGPLVLLLGGYQNVFFGLSIFALVSMLFFAFGLRTEIRKPMLQRPECFGSIGKAVKLFKVRGVPPVVIMSFFAMFVQVSLAYFLSSYAASLTDEAGIGAYALCILFFGAMTGRILFAHLSRHFNTFYILIIYNALALVGIAAMLLTSDVTLFCIFAFVPGFGLSANFPGLVVEACGLVPDDTTAASALIFLGANFASVAAPTIVGAAGDAFGLRIAFVLCSVMLIPLILMSVKYAAKRKRLSACASVSDFN